MNYLWNTKEAALRAVEDKKNKVQSMVAKLKLQSNYNTVISRYFYRAFPRTAFRLAW